jgi:hypothetical protein
MKLAERADLRTDCALMSTQRGMSASRPSG